VNNPEKRRKQTGALCFLLATFPVKAKLSIKKFKMNIFEGFQSPEVRKNNINISISLYLVSSVQLNM